MANSQSSHKPGNSITKFEQSLINSDAKKSMMHQKVSQTKALKKARIEKKKAHEKAVLLNEFVQSTKDHTGDIEDAFIQKMRNTLEALNSDDKDKTKESSGPKSPHRSPVKSP